ncbi:MAG TPA: hypothetical protein VK689_13720, partial [Armatimonadota bacterium]|nr:hypothetical protein [Armatimonadota bacterium]
MTAPATPPRLPAPTAARGCKLAGCGCIGLLLLPVLLLAGYLLWFNRLPPPVVDRRVLPRPNGFDAVVAAVKRLKPAPKDSPIHQRTAPPEDIRRALIPDRDALNAVRKAMRLEYLTPAARDFWELLPYLAQYRDASRKFAAESRLALADGKPGPAVERALDAVELGSLAGRGGGVLHNLIAAALTTIGVPQAEQLVRQLSAAEARAAGR